MSQRITIDPMTRLEGHGKIEIFLNDAGEVEHAYLQIPELRGFERFCVGRPAEEMPQITAHICGVCPAAHHLASARALDDLWKVDPPPAAHKLRELYYNLFILEDHALHFYYLGGPDLLLGADTPPAQRNVLGVIAKLGADVGARVVSTRKAVRAIMGEMSGRTAHPVFALPGGLSRPMPPPTLEKLRALAPSLVDFAAFSLDTFYKLVVAGDAWNRAMEAEPFNLRTHSMGLVDDQGRVTFYRGRVRVVDTAGAELLTFAARDYAQHIDEHAESWTYVKFPFLRARGWKGFEEGPDSSLYRVGPLGRLNAATGMATPRAEEHRQKMFTALGGRPVHRTLAFHWARLVEVMQAAEAVAALAEDEELRSPDVRRIPEATPAEGIGIVEAPRGTLIHHYQTDAQGILTHVNLIVASQHNAAPVQISVRKAARGFIHGGKVDDAILNQLEMAYRAYDPCNACASHSLPGEMPLDVQVRARDGTLVRRLSRGVVAGDA
ncbi:MAG: Ni/Fe hydrogenase subunit alpha [Deltaproteobacteria bacterium]|nr:Ni/Fe hydrogenase subunit alpha [Deltaproteobacteria bacterium]